MKLRFCVICGTNKNLEHHHIKPVSRGGDDHQHNFITLCDEHHGMIHQVRPGAWNDRRKLIREGQRIAKEEGVKFGAKPKYEHLLPQIKDMREMGWGYGTIARHLELARGTIQSICKREGIEKKKISPGRQATINPNVIIRYAEKGYGASAIAKIMNVNRSSVYRTVPNFAEVYREPVKKKKEKKYRKLSTGQFVLF